MAQQSQRRLSRTAVRGFRELPTNAAWLLSKAVRPVAHGTASATSNLTDSVGQLAASAAETATTGARRTAEQVSGAMSRSSSIDELMAQAERAAAKAQESEQERIVKHSGRWYAEVMSGNELIAPG